MAIDWSHYDPFNKNGFRSEIAKFDPTNTPKYQGPQYYGFDQSAQDTLAGVKALGINPFMLGPATDTRDAQRAAVMGQIDQAGQQARNMSDQTYMNRGTGAYRSGAARAGLDRINTGLAQAKAGAEAGIQQDFANRQQAIDFANQGAQNAFNSMLFQGAQNQMAGRNDFNMGQGDRSFQINQMNPFQAKQDLLAGGMQLGGKALGSFFA